MAAPLTARDFSDLAIRMRLVEDDVAKECLYDLDPKAEAHEMARLMERKRLLTPLQSSKLLKGDTDGYILGGYRLLYKIASGSFGRVYRGDDPRTGQVVAVKVLRHRWTDDKKKIELFEREGRIGMSLQHPNIVQILTVSKDNLTGQHFIVMEFVEGANLRDILTTRKKMDLKEGLRIIEEAAAGLTYAQSRGLTHRDIKPTNILIGTDKVAKLVDFGLAEFNTESEEHKGDSEVDRTVDYAGLEKLTNCKKGDPRSDIYFLGTVLFEMLTGHQLLPRTRDKMAMQMRKRYDVDDTIHKLGLEAGLPRPVINLVAQMCAFEPAARFQTPAIMLEGIRGVQAEVTGQAREKHLAAGQLTAFVLEENTKLQDAFRKQFRKHEFRVLLSVDSKQALSRFMTTPYHAIVVDAGAGNNGREAVEVVDKILLEGEKLHLLVAGVVILNEDQQNLAAMVANRVGATVLVRPVTMRQIFDAIETTLQLSPRPAGSSQEHALQDGE
jgi:serine/threonine protein kinase